jgi:hypothetical protein
MYFERSYSKLKVNDYVRVLCDKDELLTVGKVTKHHYDKNKRELEVVVKGFEGNQFIATGSNWDTVIFEKVKETFF